MHEYRYLIWLQGAIAVIGAIIAYFTITSLAAKSIAYGSCVTLMSTAFLVWRFKQGEHKESLSAEWHLRQAYRSTIERFIWAAAMLAAGLKFLELAPLWVLAGFIAGQAAWLFIPIWMRFENTK